MKHLVKCTYGAPIEQRKAEIAYTISAKNVQDLRPSQEGMGEMLKNNNDGGCSMNVYTTDKIRNIVLLGHGGCGKTSLTEAMAYLGGLISRMGKVADKNTVSDFGKEEQKRQFSISTSVVPIEWEGVKINILDTPGYFDFVGEVEEAVSAADAAIIVVSGKAGVEVGTKKIIIWFIIFRNRKVINFYTTIIW